MQALHAAQCITRHMFLFEGGGDNLKKSLEVDLQKVVISSFSLLLAETLKVVSIGIFRSLSQFVFQYNFFAV